MSASWPLWHQRAFLSVSGVTFLFRAATTEGNRFTHSVDRSLPEEAFSQRPIEGLYGTLVPVDVNPTAPKLDRVLRQLLTDGTHELLPLQGAPLVNPGKAIGDLCRSLASQGLSLFVAAGDVNDRESITEGFPS